VTVAAALFLTLGLPRVLGRMRGTGGQDPAVVSAQQATAIPSAETKTETTAMPVATAAIQEAEAPDARTLAFADAIYALRRGNRVDASTGFQGVTVTVASVRVRPTDETLLTAKGEVCVIVTYSKIPTFDPSNADFSLAVNGTEIPMRVDGDFKAKYRDAGGQTLTEADWAADPTYSNSALVSGVPTTQLWFDLDDWAWDESRQLELTADIGGETLSIPFVYDPEAAYAESVAQAQDTYASAAASFQVAQDEQSALMESALPVDLNATAGGKTFQLKGFLYRDGAISLSYALPDLGIESVNDAGSVEIMNLTVDGACAGDEQAGVPTLEDGIYLNLSTFALGRDPANLPDESLIAFDLVLDGQSAARVALRFRWADGSFALPADESEMAAWVNQSDQMNAELYGAYGATVFQDLSSMGLSQEIDGVTLTLTSLAYVNGTDCMQLSYKVEGDVSASRYAWTGAPTVTIDEREAHPTGGEAESVSHQRYDYNPPISIAEFEKGEKYEITVPLYDAAATGREIAYGEPIKTLTFAFTLD
jgi:hypothetical protein